MFVLCLFPVCSVFCVSIPPAVRLTLFTIDQYGIFNVRSNLGPYLYTKPGREGGVRGGGQALTRRDRKKTCSSASQTGKEDTLRQKGADQYNSIVACTRCSQPFMPHRSEGSSPASQEKQIESKILCLTAGGMETRKHCTQGEKKGKGSSHIKLLKVTVKVMYAYYLLTS